MKGLRSFGATEKWGWRWRRGELWLMEIETGRRAWEDEQWVVE